MNKIKMAAILGLMTMFGTELTANAQSHGPVKPGNAKHADAKKDDKFSVVSDEGETIDITPMVKPLGLSKQQLEKLNYHAWAGGKGDKAVIEVTLNQDNGDDNTKLTLYTQKGHLNDANGIIRQTVEKRHKDVLVASESTERNVETQEVSSTNDMTGVTKKVSPTAFTVPADKFIASTGIKPAVPSVIASINKPANPLNGPGF